MKFWVEDPIWVRVCNLPIKKMVLKDVNNYCGHSAHPRKLASLYFEVCSRICVSNLLFVFLECFNWNSLIVVYVDL